MTRAYRHPCGCRSTDSAWLELCAACKAEFDNTHQRWRAEHIERQQPSMGIKDDNARVSPPQSSLKAAPTPGSVTAPGTPYSTQVQA